MVLWLSVDANGKPQLLETSCTVAESVASDMEVQRALAEEMRQDFLERKVVGFGVAFFGTHRRKLRAVASNEQVTMTSDCVIVETHSVTEHWRALPRMKS